MPAMESMLRSRNGWRASVSWWSRRNRRFDLAFNLLSFFFIEGGPWSATTSVPKRMAPKAEGDEKATRYYGVVMRASLSVA